MKVFKMCKTFLISYRSNLVLYIAIILITTTISIISPYILGDFLDTLIFGADIKSVLVFCALFGGLNVLRILLGYVTSIIYVKVQTKMGYDMNMYAIKHVQSLSLSYTNNQDSAYLNQRGEIILTEKADLATYLHMKKSGLMTVLVQNMVPVKM